MSDFEFLPSAEIVITLEPEELAQPLIKGLSKLDKGRNVQILNLHNFTLNLNNSGYGDIELKKITEAWMWLEREGMLAPRPGHDREWVYVTERGHELANATDLTVYKRSNIIPKEVLDPILANKVYHLFIRGDYDTAVFQAFKEVEIRVRKAASLPNDSYGVTLIRDAFHPVKGKLTDKSLTPSERQSTSDLFAGAVGLFKNPASHRDVDWEDPNECAELIYLANNLLRIVGKSSENNK
jgi:uncharacterized protein (TIGR02391 family)